MNWMNSAFPFCLGTRCQLESRIVRLVDHPTGNYRFLPGIAPYSCGVVSSPGFEIVNVTFQRPVAYRTGFERIARLLDEQGRPKTALCAVSFSKRI